MDSDIGIMMRRVGPRGCRCWTHPTNFARGFTLLEMLLVLSVLVTALALIYPSISRLSLERRMLQAVEQVQIRLAAARVNAVDDQAVYQFRFEPNGRRFFVLPEPEPGDAVDKKAAAEAEARYRYSGELPTGLQFDPLQWATTAGSEIPKDAFASFANANDLAGVTWSQPLLFYPDGTSTGGELLVFDSSDTEVRFKVRPVTGGVTVSPLLRRGQ